MLEGKYNGYKFSEANEHDLPVFADNGLHTWYAKSDGLFRFYLNRSLDLKSNDFDIEEEMVLRALRKKYCIAEVPSHEYERKFGKSQLSLFKIGYKFIYRLLINLF